MKNMLYLRACLRFFSVFFIVLLFATQVGAKEEKAWHQFDSKEGGLTVLFPNPPKVSFVDRVEYKAYSVKTKDEHSEYKLVFSIHQTKFTKKDGLAIMDQAKTMYVNSQKGKIISEKTISIEDNPGLEIKFKTRGKLNVNFRIFFKDNRLYTMYVITQKKFAHKKNVSRFFKSFSFVAVESIQNPIKQDRDLKQGDHQKTNEKSPSVVRPDENH